MVDFHNETTIGTPAVDVQRITVLQRRYDLFEALEDHMKRTKIGGAFPIAYVEARLFTLFMEVEPMLKRHLKKNEEGKVKYIKLRDICLHETKEEISKKEILWAIFQLNRFLDDPLRITRLDTKQQYDPQDMEGENDVKGY